MQRPRLKKKQFAEGWYAALEKEWQRQTSSSEAERQSMMNYELLGDALFLAPGVGKVTMEPFAKLHVQLAASPPKSYGLTNARYSGAFQKRTNCLWPVLI